MESAGQAAARSRWWASSIPEARKKGNQQAPAPQDPPTLLEHGGGIRDVLQDILAEEHVELAGGIGDPLGMPRAKAAAGHAELGGEG